MHWSILVHTVILALCVCSIISVYEGYPGPSDQTCCFRNNAPILKRDDNGVVAANETEYECGYGFNIVKRFDGVFDGFQGICVTFWLMLVLVPYRRIHEDWVEGGRPKFDEWLGENWVVDLVSFFVVTVYIIGFISGNVVLGIGLDCTCVNPSTAPLVIVAKTQPFSMVMVGVFMIPTPVIIYKVLRYLCKLIWKYVRYMTEGTWNTTLLPEPPAPPAVVKTVV